MPISNRNLPEGTTLTATFKKRVYTCSVAAGEDGRLVYRLGDGTSHTSPSAAGSKVMGGVACNGWRFWSVAGGEAGDTTSPPPEPHARTTKVARPKSTPKVKQVRRVPNQRGVPEGQARWFCSACMKGFLTEAGTPPETCPEGHAREVDDEFAPADAIKVADDAADA